MTARPSSDVAVALFVFNRPDFVRQVMAVLSQIRPRRLLVVADGPRDGFELDKALCAESRDAATAVDWPCEMVTDWSDRNLGCDLRMRSGLDWVFGQVDSAIVLEDDIVPHPSFFPWCARQLDRYRDDGDIDLVSGRNTLCRWGDPEVSDHIIARRGSIHGWATWASAWNDIDHDLSKVAGGDLTARIDTLDLDEVNRDHAVMLGRLAAAEQLGAWDIRWSLARILADRWSVVPPLNLTVNIGFGDQATLTTNADDFKAFIPSFTAPDRIDAARPAPDADYDRLSLLVELLATYRQPEMAIRLARHRHLLVDADGSPDESALMHLVPVDHLAESIEVLQHLRRAGTDALSLNRTLEALENFAAAEVGP